MMQGSWESWSDRVSRLGWEGAAERPRAWRAPWRHVDAALAVAALALAALGLAAIYSSTFAGLRAQGLAGDTVMRRQLLNVAVGVGAAGAIMLIDYRRLRAYAPLVYVAVVGFLALVLTPLGGTTNGAQSWFEIGRYQVQPSEYAKVGVIVTLAALFGSEAGPPPPRRIGLALALLGLVAVEILLQPDLGTFLVFVAILLGALLVAGTRARWLAVLLVLGVVGVLGSFQLDVLEDYQKERLTAFVNPAADPSGRDFTYNMRQAAIAIGSGGLDGKGFLKGTQTNLQFVPEQRTDFIFTVIGEELGFAGASLLLLLYTLLIWRALRVAVLARDRFGALLAAGVVAMLSFQAFVNIGMTIGIMPVTGVPLPFVSYGGSSLIATFLAVGLLENVHMRRYL